MEKTTDLDKIKSRIEKMLRKAESAKEIGSLHEAEVFAKTANKLLMEYNLSMSDINLGENKQNINDFGLELKYNKTDGDWMVRLYHTIAKFNLCKVIRIGKTTKIVIIGEKYNVDLVMFISSQLVHVIKSLCSQRWKEYNGFEKKNTFKRGYYSGAVVGLYSKLREQQEELNREVVGVTALIKTNEVAIQEKVSQMFNNIKQGKSKKLSGNDGQTMGRIDGRNLQINKGIGNEQNSHKSMVN